jgi:uncharacterized membrane protein
MSSTTQILLPLALAGNGMAAGGLVIAVRGAPLLLKLPTEQYVPIHQFLVTRFDPFMPICVVTALLTDLALIFASAHNRPAQALYLLAVLLLVGAMVVSLTKNVPINRWVATLDPDALPDNFDQLDERVRWVNWNAVRMVFAVAALAVNAAALAVLL